MSIKSWEDYRRAPIIKRSADTKDSKDSKEGVTERRYLIEKGAVR